MSTNIYGARETNGLSELTEEQRQAYHARRAEAFKRPPVDWTEPGLKVTRLRLLSDPGFPMWDVSYCEGELNGQPVRVSLPFDQLPKGKDGKGRGRMIGAILEHARRDGVYARGLGILDNISTLI